MELIYNDNLKYWSLIRKYYKKKHGITDRDLDILLFMHREGRVNRKDMILAMRDMKFVYAKVYELIQEGYIIADKKTYGGRVMYEISRRGKLLCDSIYKKLNGGELLDRYRGMDKDPEKLMMYRKAHREQMNKLSESIRPQRRRPRG